MTIDTAVSVQGHILDAVILNPSFRVYDEKPKYKLTLRLEKSYEGKEIEARADWIKQISSTPYDGMDNPHFGTRKDEFFDGYDLLYFETIREPSLMDRFKTFTNDCEFIGQFVQVTGNIKYMKDGNCYLSFHIVEPKFQELVEELETGEVDDYDW